MPLSRPSTVPLLMARPNPQGRVSGMVPPGRCRLRALQAVRVGSPTAHAASCDPSRSSRGPLQDTTSKVDSDVRLNWSARFLACTDYAFVELDAQLIGY